VDHLCDCRPWFGRFSDCPASMIRIFACAIVLSLCSLEMARAQDKSRNVTAEVLDAMCHEGSGRVGEAFCAGFLFGLNAGVVQTPVMLQAGHGCVSWSLTVPKTRAIFEEYLKAHPEDKEQDARAIVLSALGLAYPCPKNAQPEPKENATDVCAQRCIPPGGLPPYSGPGIVTGPPPATEACLRACGEEIGRGR